MHIVNPTGIHAVGGVEATIEVSRKKTKVAKSNSKKYNAKGDDVLDTAENEEWVETLLKFLDIWCIFGPIQTSLD